MTQPDSTLPHELARTAEAHPDLEAVVGPDGRLSYAQLRQRVDALSVNLIERGIRPGDRVGILLANGWRWVVAALAVHSAGASVVALNTFQRSHELNYVAAKSGMRMVIAQRQVLNRDLSDELGRLELQHEDPLGVALWEDLAGLRATPGARRILAAPDCEAYLLFTSGSTAHPKAVRLLHGDMVGNGRAIAARLRARVGDRIWFATPFFFIFGCGNALPVALTSAATLCLQPRFEARDALEFIENERCTVYYGLAMATRAIVELDGWQSYDISSLRTGVTGYSPDDKRLAIETLGITEVTSVYGMTEGYGLSTMTMAGDPVDLVLQTQGRPLPTQELRIVLPDGSVADAGQTGAIELRGCVTPGYLDDPEENAKSLGADGWFRTGDLGWLDTQGRLHFVARDSEILKVKGVNVAPAEVEAALAECPGVAHAYVFGVDDAAAGQLIGTVVVPDKDTPDVGLDAQAVKDWAAGRLAAYKVPTFLVLCQTEALPKTATGKINRKRLVELLPGN